MNIKAPAGQDLLKARDPKLHYCCFHSHPICNDFYSQIFE